MKLGKLGSAPTTPTDHDDTRHSDGPNEKTANKGAANGYAPLDAGGLILVSDLPTVPIAQGGSGQVTRQAAIDALTAVAAATDEHVLTKDTATGNAIFKAAAGGGGTPGGADTQVQFNDGGAFGGDAGLTYAKATDALTVVGSVSVPALKDSAGTTQLTLAASSPHVLVNNNFRVSGFASIQSVPVTDIMLAIRPTLTNPSLFTGVDITPTVNTNAGITVTGVGGNATSNVTATSSGHLLLGLSFQTSLAMASGGLTATLTEQTGVTVRNVASLVSGSKVGNITAMHGFYKQADTLGGILGATVNITDHYDLRIDSPTTVSAGVTITNHYGIYISPTTSTRITGNNYGIFVDGDLCRFDGNGTRVFELPADATDPTGGGGAATGRIPVLIGGVTRYLAYY